jgi:hypothetical protein
MKLRLPLQEWQDLEMKPDKGVNNLNTIYLNLKIKKSKENIAYLLFYNVNNLSSLPARYMIQTILKA